ncbi:MULTISPECIES: ABC transporter permease [Streptococcus]|uniref:ABC transporter permease n=1 Tax=Streptococcus caledonicus TaxID=2614158 RepID=A0ABW0UAM6_9STRE|nr:ABC transporter permease [Streptococcus sp. S784/96/1]
MNYLKRAWLSVTRRKGKSLLLFIIIFILGNVIAGAVSIQQATQNVERKIKSQMGATATIQTDYENMKDSDWEKVEPLTKDIVIKVSELPYVKYFDYSVGGSLGATDSLQQYIPEFLANQEMGSGGFPDPKTYAFTLRGTQTPQLIPLEERIISLTSGRQFTKEEVSSGKPVALISEQLAELNNLKIGDTATFKHYVINYETNETAKETDYPLEIVGIFRINQLQANKGKSDSSGFVQDDHQKAYEEQTAANTIYLPNQIAEAVVSESMAMFAEQSGEEAPVSAENIGQPVYVLKNPDDLEKFKQEAKAYLPQFYIVRANSDNYDSIAGPVKSMSKLAGYVLVVAIGATVLITTLVVLLFLRDRKHELGIYLSLGESRGKVVLQTLVEVFMIAFVAITLAVFTGNVIAQGLSDSLLQHQINQMDQFGGVMYGSLSELNTHTTLDDVVSQYKVTLSAGYVFLMYGLGLGTVLLATIVPMAYVTRLNPKRIMM